jgi:tetratricopeptide (TPR) repeat protein
MTKNEKTIVQPETTVTPSLNHTAKEMPGGEVKVTLSKLSEEVGALLAEKRHSAALMKLTDIVASTQDLRYDPAYAALQADALGWMGFIYRQMGRLHEAQAYIDEAVEILEELRRKHNGVSRSLAKAYVNKAANAYERERDAEADMYYDKALDIAEPLTDDPCLLVEIYYEGAMLFGEIAYIEDAREILHTCNERAERIWLEKLDKLERHLRSLNEERNV